MIFDFSLNTYALVTSTTYGTWLPGEERGYINDKNNQYGTEFFRDNPQLKKTSQVEPVYFREEHAQVILDRWLEIVEEYQWFLYAVAIMSNLFICSLPHLEWLIKKHFFAISRAGQVKR